MTDDYLESRAPFAPPPTHPSTLIADYSTSLASLLPAGLVLAYVLFKSLEILGFPVWLWVHQALEMAAQTISIRFRLPRFPSSFQLSTSGDVVGTDKDAQKQTGLGLASLLGLNRGGFLGSGRGSSDVPPGLINLHASCFENSVVQGLASLPSLQDYLSKTTSEYNQLDLRTTNGSLHDCLAGLNNTEHGWQYFRVPDNLHFLNVTQHQDAQEYYSKIVEALDKEVEKESSAKRWSKAAWSLLSKDLLESDRSESEEAKPEKAKKEDTPMNGSPIEQESGTEEENINADSDPPRPNPSPVSGLIAQRVACTGCGYSEGLTLSEFNCLTVHLGTDTYRDYDIRDCLDDYTRVEQINGVQCTKCTLLRNKKILSDLLNAPNPMAEVARARFETRLKNVEEALDEEDFEDSTLTQKCGIAKKTRVESTKTKQQVVARAPKCLALHVNRSVVNEHTFNIFKNHANVLFPRELDLGPWCLGSQSKALEKADPDSEAEEMEEWSSDPNQSLITDTSVEPADQKTSPFRYALRAVVTHRGGHGSGHYVCYRNTGPLATDSEEEDQWWLFDDESVCSRSTRDVLAQGNVFMLFYERVDAQSGLPLQTKVSSTITDLPTLGVVAEIPLPEDEADDFLATPPGSPILPEMRVETPVLHGDASLGPALPLKPSESTYSTPLPEHSTSPSPIENKTATETESIACSSSNAYTPSASASELESETDAEPAMTDTDASEADAVAPEPSTPVPRRSKTPQRMRTAGAGAGGQQMGKQEGRKGMERERVMMVTAT